MKRKMSLPMRAACMFLAIALAAALPGGLMSTKALAAVPSAVPIGGNFTDNIDTNFSVVDESAASGQPLHQWLMNGIADDTGSNPKNGSLDSFVSFINSNDGWGQVLNVDASAAPYQLTEPYTFNASGGDTDTLSAMTVSMWVKQDPAQTNDAFHYLLGNGDFSVGFNGNGNGALNFGLTEFAGKPYTYDYWGNVSSDDGSFSTDKAGSWHHIAFTYGDGQLAFFIDGVNVGTTAVDQYELNIDSITIGDDSWQSHAYQGDIADVRIYGSVLSDEDIKDVINEAPADIVASLPRTLPQPVHQWLMNGSAADTGSNPKDGSLDSYVSFVNDSAWGQTLNVDMSAAPYQLSAPYGFNANGPSETLSAMTVSMWVKQDPAQTADAFRYLLGSADFSVGLNGNGALNFGLTDFVGKPYTYDSWGNVSSDPGSFGSDKAGSWHLITYTYGDGQLVFYVDGVSVGTVAADQYDINMDNITIGDDGWQSHAYQGGVADVRIYDSVLSAADVASLAVNLAIPGAKPAAAPAGWWKLDAVDTANNTTRDEITGSDDWVQAPPLTVVNDPVRGNVLNSSGTGCSGWFSAFGRDWSFASYTASIWMKLDAGAGNADVLSLGNGGDGSASPAETLHLNVNSDGSTVSLLQTYKEAGYWQPEKCILSYTLPNGGDLRGAWHNLAFTVSGNDIKLYIDGELAQDFSNTSYDAAMTIQMLTVGSFDPTYGTDAAVAVGGVYSGRLSDFRVYGYALNADNILYIANGGADYGDGDISNAGALKLSAQTSKPNTNLFTQDGSPDYIDVTVSNIGAYQGTSFDVDWTITDWNGNTTGSGALTFQQADGDVQTQEIPVDKSRLGWFSFVPTIGNGAVKLPNPNPNWGGLTNNLPYSIVADPSARRENGTYDWSFNATGVASSGTLSGAVDNGKPYQIMNGTVDAGVTLSQNGKGIDNYTYFGIVNAPPSPMPDGVDIRKLLGATVSTTSSMSWAYFFTDNNASGTPQTDVNELNIFANPGTQVSLYGEPLDYVGNLLRSPLYQVLELTPYFDNAFRIPGANGAYGGTMSAYGEEQFVNYIKGMCEIQIAQAPLRPHDYFQILWEPVDWWGAWLPAGPVGDQGIVRAYQLAYQTIHQIYDDQAVATGDPSWRDKPIVLGPTYSGVGNPDWYQRMFALGLANYIDGLSVHPYQENTDDASYISGMQSVLNLCKQYWSQRDILANPEYNNGKFALWATEEGYKSSTDGVTEQMQVLTRHNMTLLGMGFDSYQMFIYNDGASDGYGMFYTLDGISFGTQKVAPKPVAAAYAASSYLLTGYKGGDKTLNLGGTNYGYVYEDTESSAVKFALWNSAGTGTVSIPVGEDSVTVYDIMGNPSAVACPNGILTITLDQNVQYVGGVNPTLWRSGSTDSLTAADAQVFLGGTLNLALTSDASSDMTGCSAYVSFAEGSGLDDFTVSGLTIGSGTSSLTLTDPNPVPYTNTPGKYACTVLLRDSDGTILDFASATVNVRSKIEITNVQDLYDFTAQKGALLIDLTNSSDEDLVTGISVGENVTLYFAQGGFTMAAGETKQFYVILQDVDPIIGANLTISVTYADVQDVTVTQDHKAMFDIMTYQSTPLPMANIGDIGAWANTTVPIYRGPADQLAGSNNPGTYVQDMTADNCSGYLYYGWDENGVWFGADITDDVQLNTNTDSAIWSGDAIQLGFNTNIISDSVGNDNAVNGAPNSTELCIALAGPGTDASAQVYDYGPQAGASNPGGAAYAGRALTDAEAPRTVIRDEANHRTVYMMQIPWAVLGMSPDNAVAGKQIGVAATINDRDADGSYWTNMTALGLFDGIATTKDLSKYGIMTLVNASNFVIAPGLTAAPGDGSVMLTWSASTPAAESYDVYADGELYASLEGSATYCDVTGLTNGTSYSFYVVAKSAGLNDCPSNTVNSTPMGSLSSDATLASLTTDQGTLAPAFDPATTSYTVSVPYDVTVINLTPTPNDPGAAVEVSGPSTLAVAGDNVYVITVTAQDGTVLAYTVNVTRQTPPYDINGDGKIDAADLALIMANMNKKASSSAIAKKCDVDGNGIVDMNDYNLVASYIAAMAAK